MVALLVAAILFGSSPANPTEQPQPSYPPDVVASVVAHQIVSYARSVAVSEVVAYLADLEAQEAQRAAEAAAAQARQAPASSGATGACGGATNGADQYIGRESGGDPSVYNQGGSGAWGCYQIMPGTWAGSCSDLGVHGQASAEVQAQCASRLPLSAWAL